MRPVSETIKVVSDKKKGVEESFFVLRMPLRKSCHVFDLVMKTYGKPLIGLISKLYYSRKGEGEGDLDYEDISAVLNVFANNNPGMTISVFQEILDPDYVKYKEKPLDLDEIHKNFGLKFIFSLTVKVLRFNYDDFFFSKS